MGSPPGTVHAGGSADDRYCRSGRERVDTPGIGQGTKGHPSQHYPPPHITSKGPVSPQGQEIAKSLQSSPGAQECIKGRIWISTEHSMGKSPARGQGMGVALCISLCSYTQGRRHRFTKVWGMPDRGGSASAGLDTPWRNEGELDKCKRRKQKEAMAQHLGRQDVGSLQCI